MPSSDVKSYRGRGGGGYGGGRSYDDEGRGHSKTLWERFENGYSASGYDTAWLNSMDDYFCYQILKYGTSRFNLYDFPGLHYDPDSRAKRLILSKTDEQTYNGWLNYIRARYAVYVEEERKNSEERQRVQRIEWEAARQAEKARAAKVKLDDWQDVQQITGQVAGAIDSDMSNAFRNYDRVGDDGDWIEQMVDTYMDGSGFGYEMKKAVGLKLQVTVSLDLSNSMWYNNIAKAAANAFRDISMSLKKLKLEYQDDLYVAFFVFSGGEDGKYSRQLELSRWRNAPDDGMDFEEFEEYRPSYVRDWRYVSHTPFTGEDTWIAPLFEKIERWEQENSDPGAVRLDIVITDAVLEHPTDIRESDKIQERRDGSLQTVFMNFMPQNMWLGSTMPRRCFNYAATVDNIDGLLRLLLSEFVSVHL